MRGVRTKKEGLSEKAKGTEEGGGRGQEIGQRLPFLAQGTGEEDDSRDLRDLPNLQEPPNSFLVRDDIVGGTRGAREGTERWPAIWAYAAAAGDVVAQVRLPTALVVPAIPRGALSAPRQPGILQE